MSQLENKPKLIESICLKNGEMPLLSYHQERVDKARFQLFGIKKRLHLDAFLQSQELPETGRHKIRLTYQAEILSFQCLPYHFRQIENLRVVELDEGLHYRYKYADRAALEDAFSRREGCDEIIITWRGYLTDSTYANLALYDGEKWWTPSHPLLKGVRRAALINDKKLHPTVVRANDLKYFKEVRLINAMVNLNESPSIPINEIYLPGDKI